MAGVSANIGVQYSYRVRSIRSRLERRRKILADAFTRVTDTRDACHFFAATDEGLGVRSSAERRNIRRQLELASPAIQWVMISVNDIDRHVTLAQTFHLAAECEQGAQTPIARVVEVAGNDQKVGL